MFPLSSFKEYNMYNVHFCYVLILSIVQNSFFFLSIIISEYIGDRAQYFIVR